MLNVKFPNYGQKEAEVFWTELEKMDGNKKKFGVTQPYAPGIIVKISLISELMSATTKLEEYCKENILRGGNTITRHLTSKSPRMCRKRLDSQKINEQLHDLIKQGMNLPFAYDVMVTDSPDGPKLSTIEFQTAIGYIEWPTLIAKAAQTAMPELSELSYLYGNPAEEFQGLRKFSSGEKIFVLDADNHLYPSANLTLPERQAEAKLLGDADAEYITPLDIYKKRGAWFYKSRKNGKEEQICYVISRLLPGEVRLYEKAFRKNRERMETFINFHLDHSIKFLWHTSWNALLNKKEMPILQLFEETKHHGVKTAGENENLKEGHWIIKPYGENSGKGLSEVHCEKKNSIRVPKGHIAQEFLSPYPIPVPINTSAYQGSLPGTLELRVLLPPGHSNSGRTATCMYRLAPRVAPGIAGFTKTNVRQSRAAVEAWIETLQLTTGKTIKPEETPFGSGVYFTHSA